MGAFQPVPNCSAGRQVYLDWAKCALPYPFDESHSTTCARSFRMNPKTYFVLAGASGKVWVGGDCAAGGEDLTVTAVAEGRDAAEAIHTQLMAL